MIPQNILDKLSTEKGVIALSRLIEEKGSPDIPGAKIYRGGATSSTLDYREDATCKIIALDKEIGFFLNIPSSTDGLSVTIIKLAIPKEDFLVIQRKMHSALTKEL